MSGVFSQNEDWHSEIAVAPLKRNVKLWEFVLKMTQSHLAEVKNLLSRDMKPRNLYTDLCKLTKYVFNKMSCSHENVTNPVVIMFVDCFMTIFCSTFAECFSSVKLF